MFGKIWTHETCCHLLPLSSTHHRNWLVLEVAVWEGAFQALSTDTYPLGQTWLENPHLYWFSHENDFKRLFICRGFPNQPRLIALFSLCSGPRPEKWRPGIAWQTIPQDMGTFSQHCAKPNLASGSKSCADSGAGRYGVFRHQIFFQNWNSEFGPVLGLVGSCWHLTMWLLLEFISMSPSHSFTPYGYWFCVSSLSKEVRRKLPCYGYDGQDGMEWIRMDWNGIEWNGLEWNGLEWNGMDMAWHKSFQFQILREVSHESFVFTSSAFRFWGKSRTKALFPHLPLSLLEGSLARKLRFHIFNFKNFREVSH